ncbi:hypothetical protein M2475_000435 [Breznakia sp. PF5-3]|uniref:hypothetical protein n=1 Tax=unclassified Breznakia TaxID=2623764 RepID=UPI0024075F17|nr:MULTISPECIES: hypothetical protein [unclassified Breznakia]MDF9824051.1 hypothetical protein [Breznakia sp. PM6-1]MDF9834883.1 hypothetical protein [Breznakia sp. PF5-3]MDF9837095.1 hypothetical protein [Breznakia sp. PFB2-8]MDF9859020.1 hypothetical protein [Breznakia sp. PH5-24]
MAKKISDEVCLENVEKMKALFSNVIEDANRFRVVYGCGVDVGMMNFIVVRQTTYTYASYAIGFDEDANEIVILPIDRDLSAYGDPIYVKHDEVKKAKIAMFSKEIRIHANKFPKKYITFTVQEMLNQDPDEVVLCVKQEDDANAFLNFFKTKFS